MSLYSYIQGVIEVRRILFAATGLIFLCLTVLLFPRNIWAEGGYRKWAYETGGGIVSSPAIGPDGTIYVGSNDGNLYALKPDGSLKWSFPTRGAVHSQPAIGSDGTIYIGSWDSYLYAINPDSSLKWAFLTGGAINSSPVIGPSGDIYIGSRDKNLYALNPDGRLQWKFPTEGELFSTPAIGADGTIYIGSWDHSIYAVRGKKSPSVVPESVKQAGGQKEKSLTDPGDWAEIKDVRVERTPGGEEKVTFLMSNYNRPRLSVFDGGRPRLVFDFFHTRLHKRMARRTQVDGNLIRQIRVAIHKDSGSRVRVVLDLVLNREYKIREISSEEENRYTIIVSPNP